MKVAVKDPRDDSVALDELERVVYRISSFHNWNDELRRLGAPGSKHLSI